ncbi:MAG: trypsin-like peptidase domain-containing protein, partial [Propionicimonas sp.]|nr:trypsin-like peptidase domain-containing protein [Propionicimonas sp.]
MRKLRLVSLGVLLVVVLAGCGLTPPVPPDPTPTSRPSSLLPTPAEPLPLAELARFSGVAVMNAGSNCTGTLIDTGVTDGPAYVLTNGHCAGDVGRSAQRTTLDEEWSGTATFLAAAGNEDNTVTVDVVGLAYSTMRHTDTAILRLEPSLAELVALGLRPIPITGAEPAAGSRVVNIGAPVQDLLPQEWVLRRGECTLGAQHTLIEFLWLWFGAWSNDCPGIIQGSSGSPLLSLDSSGDPTAVVAMINTTTAGADPARGGACFLNRPCEVTAGGVRMVPQTSYAQSVAGVGSCFTPTGEFALLAECPLPISDVWAETGGGSFRGGGEGDAFEQLPRAVLAARTAGTIRTALVPIGDATACQDPATYRDAAGVAVPAAGESWEQLGTVVPVDLPSEEGHYLLCAVKGDDVLGAAAVLFEVDRTPPVSPAGAEVDDLGEGGGVVVVPHLDPPELATVRFTWG